MSNSLGVLTLDLVTRMGGWVDGFTQAERVTKAETRKMQKSIREVEKSVKSMGNTMRSVAGLIGISLTVSAFDSWIRGSVQAAASAGVFAEKVGVTVEELTAFRYIATEAGSSAAVLDDSVKRLNSRLGDAIHGNGPAIKTLERLNLNAKELIAMPLEAKFRAISDAMQGLERGEQLRILQNIAGDSARDLIRMFDLSKEQITELTERAERLGFVYSTEMAQSADVVLGKIGEIKGAFGNLSLQILTEFLPDIEEFLNSISLEDIEGYMETARAVIENLGVAVNALALAYSIKLAAGIGVSTAALINKGRELMYTTAKTHLLEGATKSAALAMGRQAVAANTARIALGALGGPLGMVLMAAGSFIFLKNTQNQTALSTSELDIRIKSLTESMKEMSKPELIRERRDYINQQEEISDAIAFTEFKVREYTKAVISGEERVKQLAKTDKMAADRIGGSLEDNKNKLIDYEAELEELRRSYGKVSEAIQDIDQVLGKASKSADSFVESAQQNAEKLEKTLSEIREQTARMGLKTKVEIFRYELEHTTKWDEYKGDGEQQKEARAALEAEFAKQDAMQASLRTATKSIDIAAEYRRVMEGTLTDEELRGQEIAKNLDILKQYGATEEEMLAVRRAAYESMSSDIPNMGEGGNTLTAQLARIGENMAQLDAWRDQQLLKLEIAYGKEESALAESLAKKEEMENKYRERREQFEGEMNEELLTLGINLSSESLSALQDAGMESTGVYKAMFLANKASAFANAIISANEAGAKASAALAHNPPAALAMSKMITGIGYANAGIIAATGLKGMAHSGIDRVPETGTWLLEKGERVVTSNTSAKLDATLENLRNQNAVNSGGDVYSSINVTINSDGEVESESEANGNAFANLVKKMVVDIISREMKPGGTLAKR